MIEAQKEMTNGRGSNMFLFIDDASLLQKQSAGCAVDDGEGEDQFGLRIDLKIVPKSILCQPGVLDDLF